MVALGTGRPGGPAPPVVVTTMTCGLPWMRVSNSAGTGENSPPDRGPPAFRAVTVLRRTRGDRFRDSGGHGRAGAPLRRCGRPEPRVKGGRHAPVRALRNPARLRRAGRVGRVGAGAPADPGRAQHGRPRRARSM